MSILQINLTYNQLKTVQIENIFYPIHLNIFMLILNLMPATHCKQVGTEAAKDWESCGKLKNTC